VDLVVALVEVVELLEFVESIFVKTLDLVDVDLCFDHAVGVTLIEGKHLFLLSLELTTKLSSLENLFSKGLILTKSLHALERVHSQHSNMSILLIALLVHVLLQFFVVHVDLHLLSVELTVTLSEFSVVLLNLQLPVDFGVAVALNCAGGVGNLGGENLVLLELLLVRLGGLLGLG